MKLTKEEHDLIYDFGWINPTIIKNSKFDTACENEYRYYVRICKPAKVIPFHTKKEALEYLKEYARWLKCCQ